MGYDERDSRGFPKRWTGLAAAGTNQATALLLLDGGYHELTTVGSRSGVSLPVIMPWSREITISNNGANALLVYPPSGGTISAGAANASVSLPAGSSATYWATSPTNWQDRVTGGSGGGGGGSTTITEVSQTASFTATVGAFYAISGSAAVTATLPTAIGIAGQTIRIRCANGYTGLCTIGTTSSQTIGPAAATSQKLYAGESSLLQSDGSNWIRTGGSIIPARASLYLGTSQSVTAATHATVAFDSLMVDNTGQMASITGHSITVLRAGSYKVNLTVFVELQTNTIAQSYLTVLVNTVGKFLSGNTFVSSAGTQTVPWSVEKILPLNAGDVITGDVYMSFATSIEGGGPPGSAFESFLDVTEIPSW
jgi:hypothetical protein